ncbi:MAG: 50S ribosomal protein L10 [Rickettsiales bacterium]|jgi:large subunit ribosomal protein L10|nr:50S ribosomal protein L10 [Rickettsiales bacterium]
MNRKEKENWISAVVSDLKGTESVYVADYKGLTVKDLSELRSDLRKNGGKLKVVKNRLMRLAVAGTSFEPLVDDFKGTTLIAFAGDSISMAKTLNKFAKEHEALKLISGVMGTEIFDVNGIKNLASLPTLDEARAKIIAVIQTPAGNLARVCKAYAEKAA